MNTHTAAVTTYSVMADGGDPDVTADHLRKMALETEQRRVPHLDTGRSDR